jgi:hypothetical protein
MTVHMLPMINITEFLENQPAGDAVSCGNRRDLFRKQRRHDYRCMGADICYGGDGYRGLSMVYVCIRCGTGRVSLLAKEE